MSSDVSRSGGKGKEKEKENRESTSREKAKQVRSLSFSLPPALELISQADRTRSIYVFVPAVVLRKIGSLKNLNLTRLERVTKEGLLILQRCCYLQPTVYSTLLDFSRFLILRFVISKSSVLFRLHLFHHLTTDEFPLLSPSIYSFSALSTSESSSFQRPLLRITKKSPFNPSDANFVLPGARRQGLSKSSKISPLHAHIRPPPPPPPINPSPRKVASLEMETESDEEEGEKEEERKKREAEEDDWCPE